MEEEDFAGTLGRYLAETLHDCGIRVKPSQRPGRIPIFLERTYGFYEARIAGRRCVFLLAGEPAATPADLAKHVGIVRDALSDAVVILAASSLSAHNRARLIAQGIPFAVPANQLYIPELAMDLREHFRAPKPSPGDGLSPAAQAVLFHYLLRRDESATTPSSIAEGLRYSAMSIGRAFDDLTAAGLARTERHGKERHLHFVHDCHALMEKARPLLRSPVRAVKHVNPHGRLPNLKLAGESALAELTDLTHPEVETYAVAAHGWKTLAENFQLEEVSEHEDGCVIETWSYDPAGLSDGPVVDPLSLYAQFRDHRDERIVMATERLLENAIW